MATSILGRANLIIGADTATLKTKMRGAQRTVSASSVKMNRALAVIDKGFKRAGRAAGRFAKSMVGLRGAAVLAAGAAGLGLLIKRSLDTADEIAKTADAIGITTDALQEYRFALDISGVSQAATDKSLKKFTKNMGELAKSSSETESTLKDLDPALLANLRSLDSVEDRLAAVFRAMAGYTDQAKRAAVASALFGRSGIDMTVAVKGGIAAFEGLQQRARSLGIVIKEDLLRNAENAKDQLTILAKVIGTNITSAILKAAPQIAELAKSFAEAIPKIVGLTRSFLEFIGVLDVAKLERVKKLREEIARIEATFANRPLGPPTRGADFEQLARRKVEVARLLAELRAASTPSPVSPGGTPSKTPDPSGVTPRAKPLDAALKAQVDSAKARLTLQDDLTSSIREQEDAARRNIDTIFATVETNAERYTAELDFLAQTKASLLETGQLTTANEAILERGAEAAKKRFDEATAMAEQARAAMEPMIQAGERMAWTFDNALGDALRGNIKTLDDLRRHGVDALQAIINQTLRLLAIQGGASGNASIGGLISGLIVSGIGALSGGGAAAQVAGDAAGNVQFLTPFVHGGPIAAGQAALVGERGRELFIPDVAGTIIPNDELRGGGGGRGAPVYIQTWNVTSPDANSFRANSRQISRLAKQQFQF